MFNNQVTYVGGGFFLDYQDRDQCGTSPLYPGATNPADYASGPRADAGCLWNTQALLNRTTSVVEPRAARRPIRPSGRPGKPRPTAPTS